MSMASRATRTQKRRRVSSIPGPLPDGDVITIHPRQKVTQSAPNNRSPLTRLRNGSNIGNQRPTNHTDTPVSEIPSNCCIKCRTRGGRAAYNCRYEEGSATCTRCIAEKRGKCRMATDEELRQIAARCLRCIIRGFRSCDGGDPCDVCIRNNTQHRCWKPPKISTPREHAPLAKPVVRRPQVQSPSAVRQSKRKKTKIDSEESHQDDQENQQALVDDVTMDIDGCSVSESEVSTGNSKTPSLQCNSNQILDLEYMVLDEDICHGNTRDGAAVLISDTRTKCDNPTSSPASGSSITEQTRLTDVTTVVREAEAQREVLHQNRNQHTSPDLEKRPRRSQGRVSYVEVLPDDLSDQEPDLVHRWDSEDSDVYLTPPEESEVDDLSEPDHSAEELASVSEHSAADEEEESDVIIDDNTAIQIPRSGTKKKSSWTKTGKGIDFSLPPLDNIEDIFKDMAARATKLGLSKALQKLQRRVTNVATMCSGTESPLLALELLSKALEQAGLPPIAIRHHFSAEIEAFKQGFIERNYSPAILFRDVRDFIHEDATTATTAYGAEVPIPSNLDILIAGFVCKDLSRLNSRPKGLEDDGESGDTWRAIYSYAKRFRPSIILLENVKGLSSLWEKVVSEWGKIGYEAAWLICDTKRYYLPQTRERMYMIAIERSHFGHNVKEATVKWQELMGQLQRQCSSPYEAFLRNAPDQTSEHSTLSSEPDWALCKLRYDHIRSDERLGILRPVTRWSENGTVRPPSFANRTWYQSQSSRVYDAIDVAHLQAAKKGYDSLYKMAIWDVSQNVDRFKAELGIISCITPGGVSFASNRQEALNGSHLLLLQGMPTTKLLFATETQRDRQDLAGNAMSTTVIGASLISAIISGWPAFRSESPASLPSHISKIRGAVVSSDFVRVDSMKEIQPRSNMSVQKTNIAQMKQDAISSACLCNCERDKRISKAPIRLCSDCGHTACTNCAGNPSHNYADATLNRTESACNFVQKWKIALPTRVRFNVFPNIQRLASELKTLDGTTETFIDHLVEFQVQSQYFYIEDMRRRNNSWTVIYSSNHVRLELRISRDIEWFLFANCPTQLPGNSPVRKLFEGPIARAEVVNSLLDLQWEFYLPVYKTYKLRISGSNLRYSSWRSQLGLPDYKAETVPMALQVSNEAKECATLAGEYELLPHCGTASNSLYKRKTSPHLYLLLDPTLIGKAEEDMFVFSQDCSRKQFGDTRTSLAHVDASWRPWHVEDGRTYTVEVNVPGIWTPVAMNLEPSNIPLKVRVPVDSKSFSTAQHDCSRPIVVLDAKLQENLSTESLKDYSGALQHTNRLLPFTSWQSFPASLPEDCYCAPQYPRILWHINQQGIASPSEDRKAAASFERAIKTRSSIFQIEANLATAGTRIQVAMNIAALVHRARGRLRDSSAVTTAWRVITDHEDLPRESFPRFSLLSNANDAPFTLSRSISYLRGAQPKSLSWMKAQELGKEIKITEVEEAVDVGLGWRAECRAQSTITVRGGVLADLPSFGKTVTTIALIQSEFEKAQRGTLLHSNQRSRTEPTSLIETAATLIVCPPHIVLQWQTELEKFLGVAQYETYHVLLIQSFDQLQNLSMDEITKSKVVIVSWTVFAEDEYVSQLAHFTAMPEPSVTGRRAFDTWIKRALQEVSDQLKVLQDGPYQDFIKATEALLEERLQHEDFQEAVPMRVQHGSAYQSFKAMQNSSQRSKPKSKSRPQVKRKVSSTRQVPLLHLFRYNRIVVDEYHYLNDDKKLGNVLASVCVKHINASKRWVLSGTPGLANFSDVDQIASYLGIKLGRYHFGDGMTTTQSDKAQRGDRTLVEDFLSRTEVMSRQWHLGRHERAQEFLDLFVRQNEASLEHIACAENLVSLELDIGHHAIYLELSQHLNSQRMHIRKLNNKLSSDKLDRLNASLNGSVTPEEALLKLALFFETDTGRPGLNLLSEKRAEQRQNTEADLMRLLTGFEGLLKSHEISELYNRFKEDIKKSNWLGDEDTTRKVRKMLNRAEKCPASSAFPELKAATSNEVKARLSKKLLSDLRETARELALRTRSERFIGAIRALTESLSKNVQQPYWCSSTECKGTAGLSQLYLTSQCGHTACEDCLSARADIERCVHPGCTLSVQGLNLVKATSLGTTVEDATGRWFGRKLQNIIRLVLGFPKGDQGLVFAPNDETIDILENVFEYYSIPYHSLRGCRASASAKIIEDFKNNDDLDEQSKVLILNLGSESAAGVNLTNANHIVFVSPLLAKTQYDYDSAMAQAIARSRRYGQEKKVHIYHVIAERTIDVDILEHRHKRKDGIASSGSSIEMPEALSKKEKTRLIRNNAGEMALVPISWLKEASKREMLDINESPESFASLINFSETFQHNDDE